MSESILWLLRDTRKAKKQGVNAIEERQRARLAEMVALARANSPYYRELYKDLPERVEDATLLPVTNKKKLMARFDDWCTDRDVTFDKVSAFVDNPDLIGERFLDKYTIATTSGTTGTRGIFVLDDRSFAVAGAIAFRMMSSFLGAWDVVRILAGGARMAMVTATGGHFGTAVAAARLRKQRGKAVQVFPVHMPMSEMVAGLNRFRPVMVKFRKIIPLS